MAVVGREQNMANFANKVGIVTGGAQGIGQGIARRLFEDGMTVIIVDRDAGASREWLAAMGRPARLCAITADVAREADVRRLVRAAMRRFGRLDALVNNVGIGVNRPIEKLTLAEWNRVLAANLTSMFLTVKYAAPYLRAARGGIVNISSTRALQSEQNTEAYSASKGGVVALTHALAVSLGPEIRVNGICPGWIEVRDRQKESRRQVPEHSAADRLQHPAGRVGTPEDIAAMAAFLLSQESGFITGHCFPVDGGMTIKMIYAG
jgi:NAD(P)-dependent dehydrogenase (short-subunit alcohol dehydrogenase family)